MESGAKIPRHWLVLQNPGRRNFKKSATLFVSRDTFSLETLNTGVEADTRRRLRRCFHVNPRLSPFHRALVLAAALALAAVPAFAMPMDGATRLGERGAFTAIFETLRSVWLNVWGEEGMSIDPDGRPRTSGMTHVVGNEGMSIDPDGRPNSTTPGESTDEGMSIDPNG